ncbi:MAG TPA: hypothetical protein VJ124_12970 [Pyrinomonadaceae bacterium]|nr:hypothetical protein [Pyrinomonadaceae bacterium]
MFTKTIGASLLVVILNTLAFSIQQPAPWQKFDSPEGKFNVLLPSQPEVEVKDIESAIGKLTLYAYSSKNDTSYFQVSYADYSLAPTDEQIESVLDGIRRGVMDGLKAELISEKKVFLHSYPGREFVAQKTDEGVDIIFNWKIILVGRRVYQVAVASSPKDSDSPDVQMFLASFDLNTPR